MSNKQIVHIFCGFILIFIASFAGISLIFDIACGINMLYVLCVSEIVFSYLFLLTGSNNRMGFHFIILTYMNLCQFGFVLANKWDPVNSIIRSEYSMRFMNMPEYLTAIKISLLFIAGFVLASSFQRSGKCLKVSDDILVENDYSFQKGSFYVGMTLLIVGIYGLLYAYISTRGLVYSERVLALSEMRWYGHVIVLLSFAFIMILVNCNKSYWTKALIPYGVVIIIHFILGNRGEVFYSLVTCVAVYYLKYGKINKKVLFMGLLAFVFVVPMIRQFRSSLSLSAYSFSISTNIIELFSELGFQIAPLTYTVSLIEGGISYRFGGTYLYGIFSFISGNIPFIGEISSNTMNNIRYAMPQAGIGYSQVAEAYYNFGVIGGFILMILFGFFLLKLEDIYISPKTSPYKKMFVALLTVELVNITRNNSGTFIIYICYILLLMGAVSLVSKHTIKYS